LLVEALHRRGFAGAEEPVAPLVALPVGTRRRATLAARRSGTRVALGFHARGSHRIEDIRSCLVLHPALFAALPALHRGLAPLLPEGSKEQGLLLTLTEGGIDEQRGRIASADCTAQLNSFGALPIEVDRETLTRAWLDTLALARAHRLTVYDAAYLELAARRALPLASLDEDLTAAAKKIGVAVLI
jgi:hypothetical protein